MNKKKIALIWYYDKASEIFATWRDGLKAAIEILQNDYQIDWFLDKKVPTPEQNYDIVLVWSGIPPVELSQWLETFKGKKGLLFGSCALPKDLNIFNVFDVLFIEHQISFEGLGEYKKKARLAFGTDTKFYAPNPSIVQDIEYFYPATFNPYKCQKFITLLGPDLTCVGAVQPDGDLQLQACLDAGVIVVPRNLTGEEVREYYWRAKRVIVPAFLGSERTVLEAMSMNILPRVFTHNTNCIYLVADFINSSYISPRDYVVSKYSAEGYAKSIKEGLDG